MNLTIKIVRENEKNYILTIITTELGEPIEHEIARYSSYAKAYKELVGYLSCNPLLK